MRISDRVVVQYVEEPARLVVVDGQTGNEVVLSAVELVRFFAAAGYFAAEFGVSEDEVLAEYRKGAQARLG